jgi:predicted branched-subunit amino acid permease
MTATVKATNNHHSTFGLFKRGFLAMVPLWAGAVPFGIAYGVTAREAGLSILDVQLMSLTVFSAAAQISAISLIQVGASTIEILIAAIGLNVHLPLFGVAIARELHLSPFRRIGTAYFLTDATYAVSAAQGPLRTPVLIGAGVSMYLGWNSGTALGLAAGQAIPNPQQYAFDFVVPLTFLAVVVPLIRTRVSLLVATCSASGTLLLAVWLPIGFSILIAGVSTSMFGAWMTRSVSAASEERGDT